MHEPDGGARPRTEPIERSGYEATFLATLEQRAEIAISLGKQF